MALIHSGRTNSEFPGGLCLSVHVYVEVLFGFSAISINPSQAGPGRDCALKFTSDKGCFKGM